MSEQITETVTRYRRAGELLREQQGTPEHAGAIEEWAEAHTGLARVLHEAITEGIDQADGFVTPLERDGIEAVIDYIAEYFRNHADDSLEVAVGLARSLSTTLAGDELLRKLLGAWSLEFTVADAGIPNGILGRAVDDAVETLIPYARAAQPVWWRDVMEGQA